MVDIQSSAADIRRGKKEERRRRRRRRRNWTKMYMYSTSEVFDILALYKSDYY